MKGTQARHLAVLAVVSAELKRESARENCTSKKRPCFGDMDLEMGGQGGPEDKIKQGRSHRGKSATIATTRTRNAHEYGIRDIRHDIVRGTE